MQDVEVPTQDECCLSSVDVVQYVSNDLWGVLFPQIIGFSPSLLYHTSTRSHDSTVTPRDVRRIDGSATLSFTSRKYMSCSKGSFTIGRSAKSSLLVPAEWVSVSNKHCRIEPLLVYMNTTSAVAIITDTSTHGTFVNGNLVGRNNSVSLQHNDVISFVKVDDSWFIFKDPRCLSFKECIELNVPYCGPIISMDDSDEDEDNRNFKNEDSARGEKRVTADPGFSKYFHVSKLLKKGTFGEVFQVRLKQANENASMTGDSQLAMKLIRTTTIMQSCIVRYVKAEIEMMSKVDNPFVITLLGWTRTPVGIYLLMDLARGGDLFSWLSDTVEAGLPTDYYFIQCVMLQIFRGIDYLHNMEVPIAHRDIKLDNILIIEKGSMLVKISDFGLSRESSNVSLLKSTCGTPHYVAPEIASRQPGVSCPGGNVNGYTVAVDMWACGVLLYMLCFQVAPFNIVKDNDSDGNDNSEPFPFKESDRATLFELIRRGHFEFPDTPSDVPTEARDLIKELLILEPADRLKASQACNSPWLTSDEVIKCVDTLSYSDEVRMRSLRCIIADALPLWLPESPHCESNIIDEGTIIGHSWDRKRRDNNERSRKRRKGNA